MSLIQKYVSILSLVLISFSGFGQSNINAFFDKTDQFLSTHVEGDYVNYQTILNDADALNELVNIIGTIQIEDLDKPSQVSFYINAYNLLVIKGISNRYPIQSPQMILGFFDKLKYDVVGTKMTLNELEQSLLTYQQRDARLHFVLNCAAKGCPPILNKAYRPENLEFLLTQQTKVNLNNSNFLKRSGSEIALSQLFFWYKSDFKKTSGSITDFLNQYLDKPIDPQAKLTYYEYDWTLNDLNSLNKKYQTNRSSVMYAKGLYEFKMFNNLYTQVSKDGFDKFHSRSSYFSSFNQFIYGINSNFNIGADIVFKSFTENDLASNSPFKTLNFNNLQNEVMISDYQDTLNTVSKSGFSWIAPKIKFTPIKHFMFLSVQQTVYFPINRDIESNYVSFTQVFYDRMIGLRSSVFIEASTWVSTSNFQDLSIFPNLKAFISYFPNNRWTVYGMLGASEIGAGTKFYLAPKLEVELLYTSFMPWAFNDGRAASSFNLGFRYFN